MNILSMNYCNYFVTIFHTERFTNMQTTFQNKKRTGVRKQPFADVYKIGVLGHFAKFTGKHLNWSHFLIKLHALRGSITSVMLGFL